MIWNKKISTWRGKNGLNLFYNEEEVGCNEVMLFVLFMKIYKMLYFSVQIVSFILSKAFFLAFNRVNG